MSSQHSLQQWQSILRQFSPSAILRWASRQFGDSLTLGSSLGMEDQLLTSLIAAQELPISVFVLDTGRFHEETYTLLEKTMQRYQSPIQLYFPDWEDVESMIGDYGPNLFKQSVELRKKCCFARKVKPLRRALKGKRAWITGLRQQQSAGRAAIQPIEWDEANQLYKINPLWNWSDEELKAQIERDQVLINPLHAQGYPSIGCEPCTRAVAPGEDPRAGRWWWEAPEHSECGLHIKPGLTNTSIEKGKIYV